MINVAIVEDEKEYIELISGYIKQFEKTTSDTFQINIFKDGLDIVSDYKAIYHIIFMDIQMKHLDGMKAAEEIRKLDEDVIIIFITNTVQYAVQGYTVNALGYVLKPVSYMSFSKIFSKALNILSNKQEKVYIHVEVDEGVKRLEISRIYYAESQRHSVIIHTENGDYITKGPMKNLKQAAFSNGFANCHNSYLINLNHVVEVNLNSVILTDSTVIPISRARKKMFMDALANYVGGVNR